MSARIGLLLGDASGIGPELVARLLADFEPTPDLATVVIGEPRVLERGAAAAGVDVELPVVSSLTPDAGAAVLLHGPSINPEAAPVGEASAAARQGGA